jgi:uncharacterized protein
MKLIEPVFKPFRLNAIKPQGWLAKQLHIQANGLSGHLDEFWPDIQDSAWIGGKAEGWERMPYWLDGVIPLSWLIDDLSLKQRIEKYLQYILGSQHQDGWLGPRIEDKKEAADLWSQALALKMLIGYHDATGDSRVLECIGKALRMLDYYIDAHPLSNWGQFRWFEFLIAIWWYYEQTKEQWLLDLAVKLHAQGFNWQDFFQRWPLTQPTPKGRWNYAGHVVNNAMALKEGALWWRLTGEKSQQNSPSVMIEQLDRYHGMPTGVFTGDECLAGTSAIQGTELCSVVEYMYSLEWLISVFGDSYFSDRLERIAFNALPATFSPDMWSHQYDQQVNQIECSIRDNRTWNTNGPDANIYGLEPNYGCCTANMSQGWPKFTAHLWMRTQENGIAAVAYAPSRLETKISGIPVSVDLQTEYPFKQDLYFTVRVQQQCKFPLLLRIPAWATNAVLKIEDKTENIQSAGTFHKIERIWKNTTNIHLTLPMKTEIIPRFNNAVSIKRGPLIYALKIGEKWKQINKHKPFSELPHADWEVFPVTPWNYALDLGAGKLAESIVFNEQELKSPVFSPDMPPITATVKGQRMPEWTEQNGSAGPTPANPEKNKQLSEELLLIPYGCTNLRITEFPVVNESSDSRN